MAATAPRGFRPVLVLEVAAIYGSASCLHGLAAHASAAVARISIIQSAIYTTVRRTARPFSLVAGQPQLASQRLPWIAGDLRLPHWPCAFVTYWSVTLSSWGQALASHRQTRSRSCVVEVGFLLRCTLTTLPRFGGR